MGLLIAAVLSVTAISSCGAGSVGAGGAIGGDDGGAGGDSGGGDSAGIRPAGLPPEASNPTLKLTTQFAVRVNGIVDVTGTLTTLEADEAVAGATVTVAVTHNDDLDNPIAIETATTNVSGAFDMTIPGVSDGDLVWVAAEDAADVVETIILNGIVTTIAGVATPPDLNDPFLPKSLSIFKAESSIDGAVGTLATFANPYGLEIDASQGKALFVL